LDFFATAQRQMLAGQLHDGRERLMASFEGLSEDEMLQSGPAGDWSVRDILAHVAAWDRAVTASFEQMLKGERPELLDLDEEEIEVFNAEHNEADKQRGLEEVLRELSDSREAMIELLRGVENAALFAPAPGDEHADMSIAGWLRVQVSHDEEHAEMIELWREGE
jgi:uncharacterized damage-inducible protein DinB